uniref:Uncharacterized protein n=1 Tax=Homalodisca liturata TaxID=320908 RepID=A0A1B6H619_9HEMI
MWKNQKKVPKQKNNRGKRSSFDNEPSTTSKNSAGEPKNGGPKGVQRGKSGPNCGKGKAHTAGKHRKDIKIVIRKIQRLMPSVEKAINSTDAYERGVTGCEACEMGQEGYKKMMQQIKIIEGIVSEVVEKEQRELLDADDDEESDENDRNTKKPSEKNKEITCSVMFQMYCEKGVSKHNLKCLLVTLQKMMGDTIAQICFVKARKLGDEERFRHFDISISDLNLLTYQLTGLTDDIISLIKKPTEEKNQEGIICVSCVKEKTTGCSDRLREVLQTGKSLKLVKNEDTDRKSKCCHRSYPHIHAHVHGKPIVFKYSMPPEPQQSWGIEAQNDKALDVDEYEIKSEEYGTKKDKIEAQRGKKRGRWKEAKNGETDENNAENDESELPEDEYEHRESDYTGSRNELQEI